jgi:hypothetical protein
MYEISSCIILVTFVVSDVILALIVNEICTKALEANTS